MEIVIDITKRYSHELSLITNLIELMKRKNKLFKISMHVIIAKYIGVIYA